MLGLEILQVLQILFIPGRLFVFGQIMVIFLLGCLGLTLVWVLLSLSETLPIFSDELCNFSKCEILSFEILSHLCATMNKISVLPFWIPEARVFDKQRLEGNM